MARIPLIPPRPVIVRLRHETLTVRGRRRSDNYSPQSLALYQLRRLMVDAGDRPVPIVGTCGDGVFRDESREVG